MLLRLSALVGLVAASVVPGSVAATASDDPAGDRLAVKRLPRPERAAKAAASSYDPHTVLVKFRPGISAKTRATVLSTRRAQSAGSVGGYVKVRTAGAAADALRSLRKDPAVATASLDYRRTKTAVPNDPAYTEGFQPYLPPACWRRGTW
jgi:serine protease